MAAARAGAVATATHPRRRPAGRRWRVDDTTTITITSSGASPATSLAVGSRVTFEQRLAAHDMRLTRIPNTLCNPELNVGFIQPNQSGQTLNLNTARVCTYHDHNQPSNTNLQGTIEFSRSAGLVGLVSQVGKALTYLTPRPT